MMRNGKSGIFFYMGPGVYLSVERLVEFHFTPLNQAERDAVVPFHRLTCSTTPSDVVQARVSLPRLLPSRRFEGGGPVSAARAE
jgi:hypothetical protein